MEDTIGLICGLLGIIALVIWIYWPCDLTAGTMSIGLGE